MSFPVEVVHCQTWISEGSSNHCYLSHFPRPQQTDYFCFSTLYCFQEMKGINNLVQSVLWIKQLWIFLHRGYIDRDCLDGCYLESEAILASLQWPKSQLVEAKNEFWRKEEVLGKVKGIQEVDGWGGSRGFGCLWTISSFSHCLLLLLLPSNSVDSCSVCSSASDLIMVTDISFSCKRLLLCWYRCLHLTSFNYFLPFSIPFPSKKKKKILHLPRMFQILTLTSTVPLYHLKRWHRYCLLKWLKSNIEYCSSQESFLDYHFSVLTLERYWWPMHSFLKIHLTL